MPEFTPDLEKWVEELSPLVPVLKQGVVMSNLSFPRQNGTWAAGGIKVMRVDLPTVVKFRGASLFKVKVSSTFSFGREFRHTTKVQVKFEVKVPNDSSLRYCSTINPL